MALKGNLRDFTITQLLNLINLARKTGTLIVEGSNETAWVSFRDGKLAFAQMSKDENNLAYILYKANKFTTAQYQTLKVRAGEMGDKEMGLLLINGGYITRDDVMNALQNHFIGIVNRLFTWVEGFFRFENGVLPDEEKIITRIDLENIIIEGSRRLREWEQLQAEPQHADPNVLLAEFVRFREVFVGALKPALPCLHGWFSAPIRWTRWWKNRQVTKEFTS